MLLSFFLCIFQGLPKFRMSFQHVLHTFAPGNSSET